MLTLFLLGLHYLYCWLYYSNNNNTNKCPFFFFFFFTNVDFCYYVGTSLGVYFKTTENTHCFKIKTASHTVVGSWSQSNLDDYILNKMSCISQTRNTEKLQCPYALAITSNLTLLQYIILSTAQAHIGLFHLSGFLFLSQACLSCVRQIDVRSALSFSTCGQFLLHELNAGNGCVKNHTATYRPREEHPYATLRPSLIVWAMPTSLDETLLFTAVETCNLHYIVMPF